MASLDLKNSKDVPQWAVESIQIAFHKQLTNLDLGVKSGQEKLRTAPNIIVQLPNLRSIDFTGNQLSIFPDLLAQLPNLESLELNSNMIQEIPNSIDKFSNLKHLGLSNNKISIISEFLGKLTNLQFLDLGDNKISKIPDSLAQLADLQSLNLDSNLLFAVPSFVQQLLNLKFLDLSINQISVIPDWLGELNNLQRLVLEDNRISIIPDSLSQLTNLESLVLSSNKISIIPDSLSRLINLKYLALYFNQITVIPEELFKLPKLQKMYVAGNLIHSPPPEILNFKGVESVDLEAVRAYFRQQEKIGKSFLYEAKLLIVGESGAGKTSLTRKLIDPEARLPSPNESTEGIEVKIWQMPLSKVYVEDKSEAENLELRINIWDFGGQEIYYATHQFFLTRRSLYIVVADAREQKTDFYYWLDLIEHLSDRSPVIIFNNAFQNRHWAINEQQLQAHFPDTFQKPFAFNLAEDEVGLAYLRQKIQEKITRLPHVGDMLPRTWVNVRRALESDIRATVTQQEFLQLCNYNGFTRTNDALQLSGYLHDLGVILHFQADPLLKYTVILKPEWGTDAVYRVLDNEQVKANLGFFSRADLSDIWYEDEYALLHDELLALMMKFQLCYAIPNQKDQFIAPQLLSEQPPDYDLSMPGTKSTKQSLYLRYKYEAFMPKGLLTRFIVAMHPYIAIERGQQLVWRTGAVLEKEGTLAEVVEFYHRREIRIRVAGKNMRDLLTIISYQLDELHRPFHRLKFDKLIPCNCSICRAADEPNFYRLDVLKTRLEHNKTVIECDVPPFETVQIRPLLDDVGAVIQPAELPDLLRTLNRDFNDDEFRTLCLELGVSYDNLSGEGLEGKQREFLLLMERNGRIPELINLLRQKRPNFNW